MRYQETTWSASKLTRVKMKDAQNALLPQIFARPVRPTALWTQESRVLIAKKTVWNALPTKSAMPAITSKS